ncbi:hypothetical protein HaLaN_06113 [Haematococcus lacustris]|uniref:Uncharacterized protein n=1 Tax=Haematococcus lacustris TaxID=44745 RepID=A0A699YVA5_HAELA|nr:hypothetical protein HaLaN_06113 [Haematococcus lacustris]
MTHAKQSRPYRRKEQCLRGGPDVISGCAHLLTAANAMQGDLLELELARSTSAHLGSANPPTAAAHRAVARATISCTPKHSCTNRSSEVQRAVGAQPKPTAPDPDPDQTCTTFCRVPTKSWSAPHP